VTALQAAKAECANCDGAGNCSGVGIADDLGCYVFRSSGKCWLSPDEQGQITRCQYFEECVAPLPGRMLADSTLPQARRKYAEQLAKGVHSYEMAVMPVPTVKYAKCKDCQQNVIAPKRVCPRCAKRRKLQSNNRSRMRKYGAVELLIINDL
jgi:hypothetical protein